MSKSKECSEANKYKRIQNRGGEVEDMVYAVLSIQRTLARSAFSVQHPYHVLWFSANLTLLRKLFSTAMLDTSP